MNRSNVLALLVVPAVAVLVFLATNGKATPESQGGPTTVPVESATVSCPVLPGGASKPRAAFISPTVAQQPLDGLAEQPVRIAGNGKLDGAIRSRGSVWNGTRGPALDGLRARAEGALAAGLTGAVSATLDGEERRGLVTAGCAEPAARWWFAGTSSTAERSGQLQLTNPEPSVAVVNLRFFGPDGPLEVTGARGIAVPPGKTTRLSLDNLVPGADEVAVSVTATQGRVVGALFETSVDALSPAGVDMVPAAARPAREVAITGLPKGPRRHVLSVVNPGPSSAVVDVEVLSGRGAFVPSKLEGLQVPAGGTLKQSLTAAIDKKVAGIRLTSSQPVTASVRTTTRSSVTERAYTAAGARLTSGAVAPLLPGLDGTLVLSNAGTSALTADVAWIGPRGKSLDRAKVDLRGGQTHAQGMGGHRKAAYVRITSDRGEDLVGAMHWTSGRGADTMLSTLPLRPLRLTEDRPPVRWDPVQP